MTEHPLLMAIQVDESQADELEKDYCAGFNCAAKDGNQIKEKEINI